MNFELCQFFKEKRIVPRDPGEAFRVIGVSVCSDLRTIRLFVGSCRRSGPPDPGTTDIMAVWGDPRSVRHSGDVSWCFSPHPAERCFTGGMIGIPENGAGEESDGDSVEASSGPCT